MHMQKSKSAPSEQTSPHCEKRRRSPWNFYVLQPDRFQASYMVKASPYYYLLVTLLRQTYNKSIFILGQ